MLRPDGPLGSYADFTFTLMLLREYLILFNRVLLDFLDLSDG